MRSHRRGGWLGWRRHALMFVNDWCDNYHVYIGRPSIHRRGESKLEATTVAYIAPEDLPAFRRLSPSKRKDLLRHAIQHSVAPGTVMFEQGEVPNFQLAVMSGSAQLFGRSTEGREVLIEVV